MANESRVALRHLPLLFKPHPWHGVPIGDDAPQTVTCFIEIVPTDTVKYELDKETGYLKVDRPQKFSNVASDERPFGEQLQEALDDIAARAEIATWRAVRDYIAVDRFGIRGPELERLARWAKTFWKARWELYHGSGVGSLQVAV
jgi:hypothetical protein